jgi:hypothetical protein
MEKSTQQDEGICCGIETPPSPLKLTELDRKLVYHDLSNKVNYTIVPCLGSILRSELLTSLLDTDACHACWY